MRVVVAPDKFKGSLTAPDAARRIAAGVRRAAPDAEIVEVPVADGGEGTLDAAVSAGYEMRLRTVTGPAGDQVTAAFAVRSEEAVVELARASGLALVPEAERDALAATTRGTGELVAAALDEGCRRIVLAVGGSATTDAGAGLIAGLGARLLDANGEDIPDGAAALERLDRIDLRRLHPGLAGAEIVLASDVDNPLLGESGAAAVFAPQKGASERDVNALEQAIGRFVDVLARSGATLAAPAAEVARWPGAGAAGGTGFGAMAVLGAHRRPGIDVVLEFTRLGETLAESDLVISGEGSFDEQSLGGKAPVGVAAIAARAGAETALICGTTTLEAAAIRAAGFGSVRVLTDREPDPQRSMATAATLLEHEAAALVRRALRPYDLVVRGERVFSAGGFAPAEVAVRDGSIVRTAPLGAGLVADEVVELAGGEVLIPGLVDSHVHVNEPGRTEWEGFETATRAAAAGGVTTIVDMPLNSVPPTVTVAALEEKRDAARDRCHVDVGFWGGVIPGNAGDIRSLVDEGVFGFKCFLLPSGVEEFPEVSREQMREAMEIIADTSSRLIVHAEDAAIIDSTPMDSSREYRDFLASRPGEAEDTAIAEVIQGAADTGARAHVLHLSNAASLDRLAAAKASGLALTVETCPHYLTLAAEKIPSGATAYKCCPPIREESNRDALWEGLREGTIDFIVSDHSPATPELKDAGGDFAEAWGGIASLQLGLPLIWSEARRRQIPLEQVVEWMSVRTAEWLGMRTKGRIAVGGAADLVVFAPEEGIVVDAQRLEHRHPVTPYDGVELTGAVHHTYLAGQRVTGDDASGRLLRRGDA